MTANYRGGISKRGFSSSTTWFQQHSQDTYVKQAQGLGYRARSAFKLIEILERKPLIRTGMTVLDCGASPGSWSQVITGIMKNSGKILAVDILPISHIPGVTIYQGDIRSEEFQDHFLPTWLTGKKIDVIISDLCPNITGTRDLDSYRSMELSSIGLGIAKKHLALGGSFLAKILTGGSEKIFHSTLRASGFEIVKPMKPKASKKNSCEMFFVGCNFNPSSFIP